MDKTEIDFTETPRIIRDDFARPLLERVQAYFEQPGVEDQYQAWLIEYRKRKQAT